LNGVIWSSIGRDMSVLGVAGSQVGGSGWVAVDAVAVAVWQLQRWRCGSGCGCVAVDVAVAVVFEWSDLEQY
jgi:hypothetical protein